MFTLAPTSCIASCPPVCTERRAPLLAPHVCPFPSRTKYFISCHSLDNMNATSGEGIFNSAQRQGCCWGCAGPAAQPAVLAPPPAHLQAARVVPLAILVFALQACPARLDQCAVEGRLAQPSVHGVVGLQGVGACSAGLQADQEGSARAAACACAAGCCLHTLKKRIPGSPGNQTMQAVSGPAPCHPPRTSTWRSRDVSPPRAATGAPAPRSGGRTRRRGTCGSGCPPEGSVGRAGGANSEVTAWRPCWASTPEQQEQRLHQAASTAHNGNTALHAASLLRVSCPGFP